MPDDDGPFTDDMIRGMLSARKTQAEIIERIEEMAKLMAVAGVASNRALGDSPEYAIGKWCEVLRKRAVELVREHRAKPERPAITALKRLRGE